jgi:2,4-dienoyl-CoA reductase-like NADH-dependent reductase (Old Yellow Enzyme family)
MSLLFNPCHLGPLLLPNRVVIAPMCQYSAEDGNAGDWHLMHLGSLAVSGAGLLILEATAVLPEGRISAGDLGLWSDSNEAALDRVLRALRAVSNMPLAIQLSHAGRKASSDVPWRGGGLVLPQSGGWRPLGPSALAHGPDEPPPLALAEADLDAVKAAFVQSAMRAARLGFDAIELHAAHGYLLHQFLSPLSNQRQDGYGGSLEARMRFPLEVFESVREAVPDTCAVGVRLSATDWVDGGWTLAESEVFARELEQMGCSYLHVSSGGVSPLQRIPVGPGYQVPLAAALRKQVQMPVITVGMIDDPHQAEQILQDGHADLIALARAMLYNPRWPWHAAAALGAQVEAPAPYWRCQPRQYPGLFKGMSFGQR